MSRVVCFVGLLSLAACTAANGPGEDIAVIEAPIVDGTFETGREEVVFVYNLSGGACTGAVISPYVVLTADHCVEIGSGVAAAPSNMRVFVGSSTSRFTAEYRVAQVRRVADPGLGRGGRPNDLALLVLATPATQEPLELFRGQPSSLFNATITAIGYGQTPTGGSGVKYTTTATVQGYQGGFIFVEPAVCQGDSGGPMVLQDGTVAGVVSFGFNQDGGQPQCGRAIGAYNEVFRHLEFIDAVLVETGSCIPSGAEVCNGLDDDCNGEADEGCIALGQPCTASEECVGGLCADTSIGRVCTAECDMLRPEQGCSPGFYCSNSGCDGYCVPGEIGAMPYGSACSADTDCDTLHCRDPGDGVQRCLEPCQHDAGLCLGFEVCAALAGGCGSCVAQDIFSGRGLGEPCTEDAQCGENRLCHNVAGVRECAGPCAGDGSCGELFTCRDGLCIRDRVQPAGGVCEVTDDCGDATCAQLGDRAWCTVECGGDADCLTGFTCQPAGAISVCAPATALDGEPCVESSDCASGMCAATSGGSFCTRFCDAEEACAAGFNCVRTGAMSSSAVCVQAPVEVQDGGGCRASSGRGPGPGLPLALVGLLVIGALLRRR